MESDVLRCEQEQAKMEQVAISLHKSMKGIGTDEKRLIKEVSAYNNKQRQIIKTKYLMISGNHLADDLKSEIGGYFLEAVLGLFAPLDEYEAAILRNAIHGVGTNEDKVIEILCSKDAQEIKNLKLAYKKLYNTELDADIKNEESGDLGRIFRSLVSAGRSDSHGYDIDFVTKEAENLYNAGQKRLGTNEHEFIRIMCSRSFAELYSIAAIYNQKYDKDLENLIKSEFSGEVREALLTIIRCVLNKPGYFASLLYKSMANLGTNERDLLEVVIRRSDIDMPEIRNEYKKLYRKELTEAINSEISGDFKKLMLALVEKK